MKSVVFQFRQPGVLAVRISGSNAGRFERYCARRGLETEDAKANVPYTSNVAGLWTLEGREGKTPSRAISGPPVFYETVYQVRCKFEESAKVTDAYVLHEMKSVADEFFFESSLLDGRLDFVNAPGRFTFDIVYVSHGKSQTLRLSWWVVSEKIDVVTDATIIKRDIEAESKGFVYAFLSQTKNKAGVSRLPSGSDGEWLDTFRNFFEPYRDAVDYIVHSPHLRYQPEIQHLRADRIRKWTPQLANQFSCLDADRKERCLFRTECIRPKLDTVENRFVLFTLRKIGARLADLEQQCRRSHEVADRYAEQVGRWRNELERLRRNPFFRTIGKFTGLRQENLVLLRKRGYSKIFETWSALQHAIDVTNEGLDAGNQPIWKLYEFWCYLAIRNYLRDVCKYEIDKEKSGLGSRLKIRGLFGESDTESGAADDGHEKGGRRCEYVFNDVSGNRTIRLAYQQSYSNAGSADVEGAVSAHIVEQIPDIVMTIAENGGAKNSYTYLFDAKYQIMSLPSAENPKKDAAPYKTINEMHRYRDAILYRRNKLAGENRGKLNHEVIGAYVLYPGRVEASFDYQPFLSEENIGAIPLLPGKDGVSSLTSFIDKILGRKTPESHLSADIPTRGTTVLVGTGGDAVLRCMAIAKGFEGRLSDWVNATRYFPLPASQCDNPANVGVLVIPSTGNAKVFHVERYCTTEGAIDKAHVESDYNREGKASKFDLLYDSKDKPENYVGYKDADKDGFFVWQVKPIENEKSVN